MELRDLSRSLQSHERNYAPTELEALGVVWAVRHFRQYLYGHTRHVFTDHEALKSLLNSPHPSGKLARWGLSIQELDLHIHYRPGRKNEKADALSRSPIQTPLVTLSMLWLQLNLVTPCLHQRAGTCLSRTSSVVIAPCPLTSLIWKMDFFPMRMLKLVSWC